MNTINKGLLGAAALALCTFAQAQSAYIGLGVGATDLKLDCAGTISCDNKDTGFKAFGGYRFTPNIAGEIVYLGFGKATATVPVGSTPVATEIKTSAVGAGVALLGEFGTGWTGVARLGVARVKAEGSFVGSGRRVNVDDNTTQAYFGVGVGYRVMPNLSIDLSADSSRSKISGETGTITMFGIGLTLGF